MTLEARTVEKMIALTPLGAVSHVGTKAIERHKGNRLQLIREVHSELMQFRERALRQIPLFDRLLLDLSSKPEALALLRHRNAWARLLGIPPVNLLSEQAAVDG